MSAAPNFRRLAVAQAALDAVISSRPEQTPSTLADGVVLVNGNDIRVEPVRWLWRDWLALGKLHILAGAPGHGKTTIALSIGATVASGGRWPDGTRCDAGNVLMWSGEDDPGDTLLPRLLAMGADRSRIHFVKSKRKSGEEAPFNPATDMPGLLAAAAQIGAVQLLILDPVVSAVGGADSHRNSEVRLALQPVVDWAAAMDAAVLGISHFSKGSGGQDPTSRVVGSVAFSAVARVVLVAAKGKDESGEDRRVFARSKSNIGPDVGGFAYGVELIEVAKHPGLTAAVIRWGDALQGTARELLAETEGEATDADTRDVDGFLRGLLAEGPVGAKMVVADANGAGYSRDQVQRAARRIGVERRKVGMSGGWVWMLPTPEDRSEGSKGGNVHDLRSSVPSAPPSGATEPESDTDVGVV
jgi:putative DNA primase/helicase